MLNIGEIIHHAWKVTKENRFIWWLGLLTIFTSGPTTFYSFNQEDEKSIEFIDKINLNQSAFIALTILIILSLLVIFTLIYYAYAARTGVVKAILAIEKKAQKKLSFKSSIKLGKKFVWRMWGLNLLVGLIVIILCLPLIILFGLGSIVNNFGFVFDVLGIAWILFLIPSIILLAVSSNLASIDLIVHDRKILKALKRGWEITRSQLKNSLYVTIVAIGLNIVLMLGIYLALFLIIIPVVLLGLLLINFFPWWVAGLTLSPIGILLIILLMIALSIFSAFILIYYTYSYLALEYLDKKINRI